MVRLTKLTLGLLFCALSINEGVAQYLTGAERDAFVGGAMSTCLRGLGMAAAAQIPLPLFQQYCRCYAAALADHVTIKDLEDDNPAILQPVFQAESKRCFENMKDERTNNHGR